MSLALPPAVERALRAAYATPPRAYHHWGHVVDVLAEAARVPRWIDRDPVELSVYLHDAIYVPGRSDNEARSAELARRLLSPTAFSPHIPRVQELIRLTARHGSLTPSDVDPDAAHFLDCDMAVLGAAPAEYDAYARAIAEEYSALPGDAYRAGRRRFLEKLLASPHIFLTHHFQSEREARARENLARELASLSPTAT